MLSNENSITASSGARTSLNLEQVQTAPPVMCSVSAALVAGIARLIDRKGGLIAKARAAKHLSHVVLVDISEALEGPSIKGGTEYVSVRFSRSQVDHLIWLVSEVQEINCDLVELIDTLHSDYADMADASFFARQAAAGRTAA